MPIRPLRIAAFTLCSAIGDGRASTLSALRERRSGLRPNDFGAAPLATWIGRVEGLETQALPEQLAQWECRNNRLAWRGLLTDGFRDIVLSARERYGADRIAVVMGTSTSSIGASEEAYCRLDPDGRYPADLRRPIVHTPHSLGDFVQHALGLSGISVTVATACSSSAKVFAQAERFIRMRTSGCRRRGWRRYALWQRAVRFQFAGTGIATTLSSIRCGTAWHQPGRGGGVCVA